MKTKTETIFIYTTIGIYEILKEDIFYYFVDKIEEMQTIHIEEMEKLGILKFTG